MKPDVRLLISGGRDYADRETLYRVLDSFASALNFTVLIEGEAPGADTLGREWAEERHIPVLKFPADWNRHGKAAGPIRNQQMLDEGKPGFLVAFPTPASRGTWDMVRRCETAGIPTYIYKETA